jgi:hypothetical protein
MTTHNVEATTGPDLSDRIDTVGWGLLFVTIGAVSLIPAMPDGSWLIAAGLVMLGASAARALLRLQVRGVTIVVGIVALAAGIFIVAGLTTAVGPLVLIVLGLTLIIGALSRAQRWLDSTTLAHTD